MCECKRYEYTKYKIRKHKFEKQLSDINQHIQENDNKPLTFVIKYCVTISIIIFQNLYNFNNTNNNNNNSVF